MQGMRSTFFLLLVAPLGTFSLACGSDFNASGTADAAVTAADGSAAGSTAAGGGSSSGGSSSQDCSHGLSCLFDIKCGCSVQGVCMQGFDPNKPICNAISNSCSCSGQTVNVICNGLPGGYYSEPIAHSGGC